MNDNGPMPDRVEEILGRIAAISPDAASTQQALARIAADLPARPVKRRVWRWVVPTSIAAALAIAGILLLALPPKPVSAQELLATTLTANERYRGWVHLSFGPNSKTVLHWNTQNGAAALRSEYLDNPMGKGTPVTHIRYGDVDTGTSYEYRQDQNTIRITAFDPQYPYRGKEETPLDFPTLLKRLREVAGEDAVKITQTQDRGMDRFDLTIAEPAQRTLPKEFDLGVGSLGRPSVVWVDPKTKLIAGVKAEDTEITFTYGMPEIHSIYDLEVPKDAKVIDMRPAPETLAAVKRVRARAEKPFPDGVVTKLITTRYNTTLVLYFRQGKQWAMREYRIVPAAEGNTLELPADWTRAGHGALMQRLSTVYPAREITGDGTKAWEAEYDPKTGEAFLSYAIMNVGADGKEDYKSGKGVGRREMTGTQAQSMERIFSPTRDLYPENLGNAFATDNRLDVLTSPDRPGQVCFRVLFAGKDEGSVRALSQDWVDAAHEDRAVTFMQLSYSNEATRQVSYRSTTQFSAYAQLPAPDGRSYPTHWTLTSYGASGNVEGTETTEFRFYPQEKLPPLPQKAAKP